MKSNRNVIFKNSQGELIDDPSERIHQINEAFEKNNAEKFNYSFKIPNAQIGGVKYWGDRKTQEDEMSIGFMDDIDLAQFSPQAVESILLQVTHCLEAAVENFDFHEEVGSTFIAMLQSGKSVYTVNAGDSIGYICKVTDFAYEDCLQVNEFHQPTTEKEAIRLLNICATVEGAYLRSVVGGEERGIAVSRGLGDNSIYGISHEPDVYHHVLDLESYQQAMLVVASDGLIATKKVDSQKVGQVIVQHIHSSPEAIAENLVKAAISQNQLPDNTAVCVAPFDSTFKGTKYLAVFDGHGKFWGHAVANVASCLFPAILEMYLLRELLKKEIGQGQHTSELTGQLIVFLNKQNQCIKALSPLLKIAFKTGDLVNAKERLKVLQIYFESQVHASRLILANIKTNENQKIINFCLDYLDLHNINVKSLQKQHCPHDASFLPLPEKLAREQLDNIKLLAGYLRESDYLNKIYAKRDSYENRYINAYQQANLLLSIREKYNPQMPISFFDIAFSMFTDDVKRKTVIKEIEDLAKKIILEDYPLANVVDQLEVIKNEFADYLCQPEREPKPKSSMMAAFRDYLSPPIDNDKKLLNCIDDALHGLKQELTSIYRIAS